MSIRRSPSPVPAARRSPRREPLANQWWSQRAAPQPHAAEALPPWWPPGLRARPATRFMPPDPLPPDPPERALQRLGPLELPGLAPAELERRLAWLYGQLQAADASEEPG